MEEEDIRRLINNFLTGEITDSEIDLLKEWLGKKPEYRHLFDFENEVWQKTNFTKASTFFEPISAWQGIKGLLTEISEKGSTAMFVIADRLNGMFSDVNEAIKSKDASVIQNIARQQLEGGGTALDINAGRESKDPAATLVWMAEAIREVTDAPICVDTAKPDIMKAVVPKVPGAKMMNSTKADPEMAMSIRPSRVPSVVASVAWTLSLMVRLPADRVTVRLPSATFMA